MMTREEHLEVVELCWRDRKRTRRAIRRRGRDPDCDEDLVEGEFERRFERHQWPFNRGQSPGDIRLTNRCLDWIVRAALEREHAHRESLDSPDEAHDHERPLWKRVDMLPHLSPRTPEEVLMEKEENQARVQLVADIRATISPRNREVWLRETVRHSLAEAVEIAEALRMTPSFDLPSHLGQADRKALERLRDKVRGSFTWLGVLLFLCVWLSAGVSSDGQGGALLGVAPTLDTWELAHQNLVPAPEDLVDVGGQEHLQTPALGGAIGLVLELRMQIRHQNAAPETEAMLVHQNSALKQDRVHLEAAPEEESLLAHQNAVPHQNAVGEMPMVQA